ncbi:MAG: PspC domain-containing protein [Alphaproteobacteria bacterium]
MRDADNGMIAGVCAGIARHLGVRPKLVRIVTILSLVIFTVPTVVAYGLMAWLAPSDADSDRVGEASGARDGEPAPDGYRGEGGAAEGLARLKTRFRRLEEKFADVEAQMLNEATD